MLITGFIVSLLIAILNILSRLFHRWVDSAMRVPPPLKPYAFQAGVITDLSTCLEAVPRLIFPPLHSPFLPRPLGPGSGLRPRIQEQKQK